MTADIITFPPLQEHPDWPTTLDRLQEGDREVWEFGSVPELTKAMAEAAAHIERTGRNLIVLVSVGCLSISVTRWPDEPQLLTV